VLVLPDYKNSIGSADPGDYGYSFKNGNLQDPLTGKAFATIGTVHSHPEGSGPSTYVVKGYGDLGMAAFGTPGKPVFVLQNNSQRTVSFIISKPSGPSDGRYESYDVTKNNPQINVNSIRSNQSLRGFAKTIKF
jgi:hypothetical protein